jgi:hypothetical protein
LTFDNTSVQEFDIILNSGLEIIPGQLSAFEDEYFVYSTYDLTIVNSGDVFSAFASYRLSDITLYMTLTNSDGKEVAIDTTELLDTVYDDVNIVGVDDMLSYIQIPSLESGKYKLTITVPKGHWTYTR